MFSLPILVLFLNTTPIIQALLPKNEAESFYGLATVAANLVTLDNTDVVIISDFELKQQVSFHFDSFVAVINYVVSKLTPSPGPTVAIANMLIYKQSNLHLDFVAFATN